MKIIFSKEVHDIPVADIRVSDNNVRLTDKEAEIEDLAKSIEQHGLLQPVDLKGKYGSPPYELIVGQRRYLAHQLLKKQGKLPKGTIRAVFLDKNVSDVGETILSLAENLHRRELNHADKARAITKLYLHYRKDEVRVARELGLRLKTVRDYIAIEEQATPKAKELLRRRKVSKSDVKRVIDAAQGDLQKADKLLDKIPLLSKFEKVRAVSFASKNPKATADKILEEGQKVRTLPTVILSLTEELDGALSQAEKYLSMDRESIAVNALTEWLNRNGYLKSKER
jgi:ParB family chromosome partitioning protein